MIGADQLSMLQQWSLEQRALIERMSKAVPYVPPGRSATPSPAKSPSRDLSNHSLIHARPAHQAADGSHGAATYDMLQELVAKFDNHLEMLSSKVAPAIADVLQESSQNLSHVHQLLPKFHADEANQREYDSMTEAEHTTAFMARFNAVVSLSGMHSPGSTPSKRKDKTPNASIVHPSLQRLLKMSSLELEERRLELEAERAAFKDEDETARALEEEEEEARRAAAAGSPKRTSTPTGGRSSVSILKSSVNKVNLISRFRGSTSTKRHAPFPYAYAVETEPTFTFLRKLVKTLQQGTGSTVLQVVFSAAFATIRAMTEEAEDPAVNLTQFVQSMTVQGQRAAVSIREAMPHGCSEASWRKEATHRQFLRHCRGSTVFAKRSADAVKERLSFAADRPKGLLETFGDEMSAVSVSTFSDSLIPKGGPPFTLMYPKSGLQVAYFSTRSESGSWVTLNCAPWLICPSSYAIASTHPMYGGCTPQNWVLEGSNDNGLTFTTLRTHTNDNSFLGGTDFAIFDINPLTYSLDAATEEMATQRFIGSMFRIRANGPNALGSSNLQVAALEFYGRAMCCQPVPAQAESEVPTPASSFGDSMPKTLKYGIPVRVNAVAFPKRGFAPLPAQPPDAPPPKAKGKKK